MILENVWHWLTDRESWRADYGKDKSARMTLRMAMNYAGIFGGKVIFDPERPSPPPSKQGRIVEIDL